MILSFLVLRRFHSSPKTVLIHSVPNGMELVDLFGAIHFVSADLNSPHSFLATMEMFSFSGIKNNTFFKLLTIFFFTFLRRDIDCLQQWAIFVTGFGPGHRQGPIRMLGFNAPELLLICESEVFFIFYFFESQ